MTRPLLLVGLGGFGKWVVTALKAKVLDTYGKKPDGIDWLSLDLTPEEKPPVKYPRFELGRLKEETLDFSKTSPEFVHIDKDIASQVTAAREDKADVRFAGRLSKEDAEMIVTSQEQGLPAAERRHASMIPFILDIDKVERTLRRKLKRNGMIFVVNSLAGGTGTGVFLDFVLLLRKLLAPLRGTVISIILLPFGFTKVKQNEDMNPLYANCYAGFRELMKLFYPKGNTRVSYSLTSLNLKNIVKERGMDVISDLVFIVDGSTVGGRDGSEIEHYQGVVPAITGFVESAFLGTDKKAVRLGVQTQTSFDNAKAHAVENFVGKKASEDPYNAFAFASFGTYRLVFDSQAVKNEFAHRIAIRVYEQFLEPSWLPDPEFAVKRYEKNPAESTKFDKDIVHTCLTKGGGFATFSGLKNRLETEVRFPDFGLGEVRLVGKVRNTKEKIDARESYRLGGKDDQYSSTARKNFYSVYNKYAAYYPSEFKRCVRKKILNILRHGQGTDSYGRGSLRAAEHFIRVLKNWYILFLKGFPERNVKPQFAVACDLADQVEGTYSYLEGVVSAYYEAHRNKGRGLFGDPRKEYRELRARLNRLVIRDLLRKLVREIAGESLVYLEELHQQLSDWISTIEDSKKTLQEALNSLLEVRMARKEIACDEYLTESDDSIERRMFELVVDDKEWKKLDDEQNPTDEFDARLKEILHNIPNPSWAEVVGGFTWNFNLPDKNGKVPYPRHPNGGLVLAVPSGMPDFPGRSEWSREDYVRTWNYELVRFYLTYHRLSELDKISVVQILMLKQHEPRAVLERLKERSVIMLFCDERKLDTLKGKIAPAFAQESHYFITGDFGCQQKGQPKLQRWLNEFARNMNAVAEEQITEVDTKQKPNEIVFTTAKYCLPAPVMMNLASTEAVYLTRMRNKVPPPLHIFKGEKSAFRYETKIQQMFRSRYEKLHPQVVSILEDKTVVGRVLWAKVLGFARKEKGEIDPDTHQRRSYLLMGSEKFRNTNCFCDAIYELIYPPDEKENEYRNLLEDLKKQINEALHQKDEAERDTLKRQTSKELRDTVSKGKLPRREADLYKVWTAMLKEEDE